MTTAFPLAWPPGWPRTAAAARQDSKYRFKKQRWNSTQSPFWTFAEARDALMAELERLGARHVVLSSNYELRLDGLPSRRGATPDDTGIAVYFDLRGKPLVMACDLHLRGEENMRSIALAIEAMRQLERHGGGVMMERAFAGFQALPAPAPGPMTKRPWREVLLNPPHLDGAEAVYRRLAKERHPDNGGSHEQMAELNAAIAAARKELR